ncbi:oxidoreductase [Paenibacillus sp. PK3_47]|uniref:oxidoreductase n=1 Tax=Paenibacillus sp. PK3_47 TaxID=2072642 RepID=UPI00201E188A|nr:oxidoreductase [Paenibacillus sp. PK3_47]UQZ32759.1 oxidoreductase [Paenibacillus sp. PK3_47]
MMKISTLEARASSRADFGPIGEGEKNTRFADLIIAGKSLNAMLIKYDMVPSLGWMSDEYQREMIDYFLLRKPHGTMWYRYPIMVCPWCGDEGCGFISVKIDKEEDVVIWKDFYLEPDMKKINIGPFYFEWDNYERVINSTFGVAGIQ